MTKQQSFSHQEHELRHEYREMMDQAESTEDVKKFFFQLVRKLLRSIIDEDWEIEFPRDVNLDFDKGEGWVFSERLLDQHGLRELLDESDLDDILDRFAETSWHRYQHLEKNPEKTEKKIYPRDTHYQSPPERYVPPKK